jgi:CBS domain-containing protein
MKVRELMATNVKYCRNYNTLSTAAQLMWDHDIGCLPVLDSDGRMVGILTDRDICMAAYLQGGALGNLPVTNAMSRVVFSCKPGDDLKSVERTMREHQIRRMPVVDDLGNLVGMISLSDIVREAQREAESDKPREISDAEIARVLASICAPRHHIVEASA